MDQNDIPEDLKQALSDALHRIAVHMHDAVQMSHIIIRAEHISNSLDRKANTMAAMYAGGIPVKRDEEPVVPPAEQVDSLVKELMAKARGQEKKDQ